MKISWTPTARKTYFSILKYLEEAYFCVMTDRLNILKELKLILLHAAGEDIKDVVLYGSQIRKNRRKDSDYDILIVLNRKYNWPERRIIRDLCYEISLKYDILIDSKIVSIQELQNSPLKNHPLYLDALNEGIYA